MRTRIVDLKSTHPISAYLHSCMENSRALRNTVNFWIRNTMTGLKKTENERTELEKEVLATVFSSLHAANEKKLEKFCHVVRKSLIQTDKTMKRHALIFKALSRPFGLPDKEHCFLDYYQLDAISKQSHNEAYYNLPAQSNQKAIRKTAESWKGYFKALERWKKEPAAFLGRPRIPGYLRARETTAAFSNQICHLKNANGKTWLSFPGSDELVCVGNEKDFSGKFVKVEVSPHYGRCRILITMEDETADEDAVPDKPQRVLGIDPGVTNLLTCVGNFGDTPFIIAGGPVKARNQWFNKHKAQLCSLMQKGKDSKHSRKSSHALDTLSYKRETFFRDYFYKLSHYICRYCMSHKVDVIVFGHNEYQKQEIEMGKQNNQNFVSIPMERLLSILKTTAAKYGIPVVVREESYTSKASLLDMDVIPTYGKEKISEDQFSGKRLKRGVYCTGKGIMLNADVNAAGNILRKEYPDAFENTDLKYLSGNVRRIEFHDLYPECRGKEKAASKKAA